MEKNELDELIYSLKTSGFNYEEIAEYLEFEGIMIDLETIKETYKRVQLSQPKKVVEKTKRNVDIQIPEEELYKLRQQGLSYRRIAEYFTNNGVRVSGSAIRSRCKKVYEKKGEEEPAADRYIGIGVTDQEIYSLREKRLSYREMTEYLKKHGKIIGEKKIKQRCKEIYRRMGKEVPKAKRVTKKDSLEQLELKLQNVKQKKERTKKLLQQYIELETKLQKDINIEMQEIR